MRSRVILALLLACAARASFALTCTGAITVTPTGHGTIRLHYEDLYAGYSPMFGAPALTQISTNSLAAGVPWPLYTIVQPVADIADSAKAGAPAASTICHAEELDLGPPQYGFNEIDWIDNVSVNGASSSSHMPGSIIGFWWQGDSMLCSSSPRFVAPSPALDAGPTTVTLNVLSFGGEWVKRVTLAGQTITIDTAIAPPIEGPIPYYPAYCMDYTATLNGLRAGDYVVLWRLYSGRDQSAFQKAPINALTYGLTVHEVSRRRGVRH
jgi:hypothetical protein